MKNSDRPLAGIRALVTRPRSEADPLAAALQGAGAAVVHMPLVRIEDPESWHALDAAVSRLVSGGYEWAVFTSTSAIFRTFARLRAAGLDASLESARVAAVGKSSALALSRHGVNVVLVPREFTGRALAESMGRGPGRVFLPRVEGGPRSFVDALTANGWDVDEVVAYRNKPEGPDPVVVAELRAGAFDVVTFTSGSAAAAFAASVGAAPEALGSSIVASIGPSTSSSALAAGLKIDLEADEHTAEGLVDALCTWMAGARE